MFLLFFGAWRCNSVDFCHEIFGVDMSAPLCPSAGILKLSPCWMRLAKRQVNGNNFGQGTSRSPRQPWELGDKFEERGLDGAPDDVGEQETQARRKQLAAVGGREQRCAAEAEKETRQTAHRGSRYATRDAFPPTAESFSVLPRLCYPEYHRFHKDHWDTLFLPAFWHVFPKSILEVMVTQVSTVCARRCSCTLETAFTYIRTPPY